MSKVIIATLLILCACASERTPPCDPYYNGVTKALGCRP
jgi:hypothetical protein